MSSRQIMKHRPRWIAAVLLVLSTGGLLFLSPILESGEDLILPGKPRPQEFRPPVPSPDFESVDTIMVKTIALSEQRPEDHR